MKGSLISHLPDIIRVKLLGAGNVFISLDLHIGSGYQPSPGSLKGIGAFSFSAQTRFYTYVHLPRFHLAF
ncbi:hypothetical protein VVS222_02706 [Vibrio vulnificus]|nr:hypothetical protein VVS222_02706 [Vibrio vulnificus]